MWLGDVGELPLEEQFYLRSENICSNHRVSSEFYEAQIEVTWAEPSDERKLFNMRKSLYEKVLKMFSLSLTQLETETVKIASKIQRPVVNTEEAFSNVIIAMNMLFVESINSKGIKQFLKANISSLDLGQKGSLKLFEVWLSYYTDNINVGETVSPLFVLYDLRVAMAHLQSEQKKTELFVSSCQRMGLNVDEIDYLKVYDTLLLQLTNMYTIIVDNLKKE